MNEQQTTAKKNKQIGRPLYAATMDTIPATSILITILGSMENPHWREACTALHGQAAHLQLFQVDLPFWIFRGPCLIFTIEGNDWHRAQDVSGCFNFRETEAAIALEMSISLVLY